MDTNSMSKSSNLFPAGTPVLCRCTQAGVHAGLLVSPWDGGPTVVVEKSRRLWSWQVKSGKPAFLSGVAVHGLDHEGSRLGTPITVGLTEVCEVILMTPEAWESVCSAPEVNRS